MNQPLSHDELFRYLEGEVTVARAQEIESLLAAPENAARVNELRTLREHLSTVLVPSIDLAAAVRRRLAETPPPTRKQPWLRGVALFMGAAAALFSVFTLLPGDDGFRPKGQPQSADRWVALHVYRTGPLGQAELVTHSLQSADELWFAYTNLLPSRRYLMVFSVDGTGHVDWYYPADDNMGSRKSIPILQQVARVELSDRVSHHRRAGPLDLVALFTSEPLDTADIERLAKDHRMSTEFDLPHAAQHVLHLMVGEAP